MHIELHPIDSITPYDKDPRVNDGAVDTVAASLKEFGLAYSTCARPARARWWSASSSIDRLEPEGAGTMNLGTRIKRLERATDPVGACRACHGDGPSPAVVVCREGQEPESPTCGSCGLSLQLPCRVVVLPTEPEHV